MSVSTETASKQARSEDVKRWVQSQIFSILTPDKEAAPEHVLGPGFRSTAHGSRLTAHVYRTRSRAKAKAGLRDQGLGISDRSRLSLEDE